MNCINYIFSIEPFDSSIDDICKNINIINLNFLNIRLSFDIKFGN